MSSLQKKIGNHFRLWSKLKKNENFHSWNSCLKASTFSQTEPVYEMNWLTSKLQSSNSLLTGRSDCLRFDSVYKQYWVISNFLKLALLVSDIESFPKLISSMKPFGMFHRLKFLQKKLNFCKPIQTMKWIVQHQSMSSLHEKNIGNQFRLCSKLKNKKKIFPTETACLKASTFSQTDPVKRNWLTSKLQSSNSLLEVSSFCKLIQSMN